MKVELIIGIIICFLPLAWGIYSLGTIVGFERRSKLIKDEWKTINDFKDMKKTIEYENGYKDGKKELKIPLAPPFPELAKRLSGNYWKN